MNKNIKEQEQDFQICISVPLKKTKNNLEPFHIAGDFNLNIPYHDKCSKVDSFLNLLYENDMIPIINKPTRVTRKTATAIDHIPTYSRQKFSGLS